MQPPHRIPIGLELARTAKAVTRAFDDTLTSAGGGRPAWLILLSLKTRRLTNQRELAEAVGIQTATLTHHLNAMENDGLITRRRDPENRRVHLVELTDDGEAAFLRLRTAAMAHDERLRAEFTEKDLVTLHDLLVRLRQNVSDGPPDPPFPVPEGDARNPAGR
ncbi:MAG: MarR family transcriptional regulator [Actinocatenispora sp.]